jgi:hypothetical protein
MHLSCRAAPQESTGPPSRRARTRWESSLSLDDAKAAEARGQDPRAVAVLTALPFLRERPGVVPLSICQGLPHRMHSFM